jgi:hypothetical protein
VRQARIGAREKFVPLSHSPGEAQADFVVLFSCSATKAPSLVRQRQRPPDGGAAAIDARRCRTNSVPLRWCYGRHIEEHTLCERDCYIVRLQCNCAI